MKRRSRRQFGKTFVSTVLLCFAANAAVAGDDPLSKLQSISKARHHEVVIEDLDRSVHVIVNVPDNYEESGNKKYPTVYLLDGGVTFPMLAGYSRYLRSQGDVPDLIVVGISYASNDFETGNFRSTDYTAPSDERAYYGGASRFQQLLETQILPMVETSYRSDPKKRVIFGQSIGGQFALYTAMTKPDLFWGHIASNPALHRNLDFFLQPLANRKRTRSMLFVASASDDERRFRVPAVAWIDHWSQQKETPWRLNAITINGYGHFSLVTESFRQGLTWIFD